MNRCVLVAAVLLFAKTCGASLDLNIPVPLDDWTCKHALWTAAATAEEIAADRELYWALEGQLRTLSEGRLRELFGVPRATLPAGYALPVHHHAGVGFSGLGYQGQGQSYFLPIADLGGVLVFPYGDGKFVSAVALYLKMDPAFVAVQNPSDYPDRRAWELARTEAIRKHLQDVLRRAPADVLGP